MNFFSVSNPLQFVVSKKLIKFFNTHKIFNNPLTMVGHKYPIIKTRPLKWKPSYSPLLKCISRAPFKCPQDYLFPKKKFCIISNMEKRVQLNFVNLCTKKGFHLLLCSCSIISILLKKQMKLC